MGASEIFGGVGLLFSLILLVLGILIPLMIYTGQKWAYKCYGELKKQTLIQKDLIEAIESQKYQLDELNLSMKELYLTLKER